MIAHDRNGCHSDNMTAETRGDRYRKVAENELASGNPRDPVLNQSIESAAQSGGDLSQEYTQRRTEQMLADEAEREQSQKRRMELNREIDAQHPGMMLRTSLLIAVIVAVVVIGFWLLKSGQGSHPIK